MVRYLGWIQGGFFYSVENPSVWELRHLQRTLKGRKEGRKLATVPFEKAPEEFFVPALGAWAFVWLHSRGSQSCAVPCAVPLDCALL